MKWDIQKILKIKEDVVHVMRFNLSRKIFSKVWFDFKYSYFQFNLDLQHKAGFQSKK